MSYNAITIGDPAGIGPEIAIRALMDDKGYRNNTMIIGSKEILVFYSNLLENPYELNIINEPEEFEEGKINILHTTDISLEDIKIGEVAAIAGDAAYHYLERAINLALENRVKAIITGPLNKEALHLGGHNYDGHTEIFANLTHTKKYTMMLWSDKMAVVHVSTHVPLRKACDLVKKDRVVECIELAQEAMKNMGVENPRIAVAGLNPHSGESGLFGNEDQDEILPAVEEGKSRGFNVEGPVAPDTVFLKASQKKYDVVVAMYHDQGHIPMKLLDFDQGVNITLGLPIIRASVDHGTAFDIAGKGIAKTESIMAALKAGSKLAK